MYLRWFKISDEQRKTFLETGSNYCRCDFIETWPLWLCLLKAPTRYKPALLISILALLLLLILNSTGTCTGYVEGCILTLLRKAQQQQVELESHSCAPVSFVFCTAHHSPQRFSISLLLYFCKWNKIWRWLSFVYLETSSQKLSYFRDFKFEDIHNDSLKYLETKIFILREFNIMIISFIEPITWWLQYQISKRCPAHHPSTITSALASGLIFGDFLSKVFTL